MKVVKTIFKVLWWIILLPLLPAKLAWRWSNGALVFKKEFANPFTNGLAHLIMACIYAVIMYSIIFAFIGKVLLPLIGASSESGAKSPAPIVEKTVDQANVEQTSKEADDVLRDK